MIKVSAIVSLYNSIEYVEECLHDLVHQSLFRKGALEIVVIDSASPHDERVVVERFQREYPHVVYHRTEQRETLYQAWNRGVAIAQGEYVTNANSDDRHHSEGLEIMCRALDKRPDVDLVYADVFESCVANERFTSNPRTSRYCYPTYFAPLSLLYYQFGCQPMWRKSVHKRMGDFNGQLRAAGDWEFAIRFSLAGLRALHIPQALGSFLTRPTSISSRDDTSVREQRDVKEAYLSESNILKLYAHEGYSLESPQGRAAALTDFAHRASHMALPWTPGKIYREPIATLVACLGAYETQGDDPMVAWNLGVSLHNVARHEEAMKFLRKGAASQDPTMLSWLHTIGGGQEIVLPLMSVKGA